MNLQQRKILVGVGWCLIFLGFHALPQNSSGGWFGEDSYEDCILENMKKADNDTAARLIAKACRDKFPVKQAASVPVAPKKNGKRGTEFTLQEAWFLGDWKCTRRQDGYNFTISLDGKYYAIKPPDKMYRSWWEITDQDVLVLHYLDGKNENSTFTRKIQHNSDSSISLLDTTTGEAVEDCRLQ